MVLFAFFRKIWYYIHQFQRGLIMNYIELDKKYIFEYMLDILNSSKVGKFSVDNARYHHNASFLNGVSIVENGILSISELNRLKICEYSCQQLKLLDDIESHANGNDGISLSVVGLTDLYGFEDEYNPFFDNYLDILVSSSIKVFRYAQNYGNEFIALNKIDPNDFRSIDIRLLKSIQKFLNQKNCQQERMDDLINKYNSIINLSQALENRKEFIPLREMSFEPDMTLDTYKLSKLPILVLKR